MWIPSLKMLFLVAIQIVRWSWHEYSFTATSNNHLCLLLRFVYVRYALGLVKDGTKLLHWIVIIYVRKGFKINSWGNPSKKCRKFHIFKK